MMMRRGSNRVSLGRVPTTNAFQFRLFNYVLDDKPKKLVQLLADSGCEENVDACNSRGQTALFVSCILGNLKCVMILLKLGANTNRRSDDGSTPVHAASFSCSTSILQQVIRYGGDLRLHDYQDLLPRDWAVEAGAKRNKKVLELIDLMHYNAVKSLLATPTSSFHHKSNSLSLNRSNTYSDSTMPSVCANKGLQLDILQHGFGNFVSFPLSTNGSGSNNKHFEVGFISVTPTINKSQISHSSTEPTVTYQAPPCFFLSNGFWGSQPITIKKINKTKKKTCRLFCNAHDLLISELNIMRHLLHPHILTLMGAVMEDIDGKNDCQTLKVEYPMVPHCFVFERVSLGSLHYYLHVKQQSINLNDSIVLILQVLEALSFLHQRGFIHCCLSSHAIQLVNPHTAKLSEFYYAVHSGGTSNTNCQINPVFNRWMAPEILAEKKPSFESDIYNFCVIISEAVSGILPWHGYDLESIRNHIVCKGHTLKIPDEVPKMLSSVIIQGLSLSRHKRSLKLKQLSFALKYMLKSGSLVSGGSTQEVNQLSTGNDLCLSNIEGDRGIDVPDAVRFCSSTIKKGATPEVCNASSSMVQSKKAFAAGESSQNYTIMKSNTLPPWSTSRGFTGEDQSATLMSLLSPKKTSNAAAKSRSLKKTQILPAAVSDEDIGYIHPDLLSTDANDSNTEGSSLYSPSRNESTHTRLQHNDERLENQTNLVEEDGRDHFNRLLLGDSRVDSHRLPDSGRHLEGAPESNLPGYNERQSLDASVKSSDEESVAEQRSLNRNNPSRHTNSTLVESHVMDGDGASRASSMSLFAQSSSLLGASNPIDTAQQQAANLSSARKPERLESAGFDDEKISQTSKPGPSSSSSKSLNTSNSFHSSEPPSQRTQSSSQPAQHCKQPRWRRLNDSGELRLCNVENQLVPSVSGGDDPAKHPAVAHDSMTSRDSSHSERTRALHSQSDERSSPLHDSVQRVQHSLVELSRILKLNTDPAYPGKPTTTAQLPLENDHPLEGLTCTDSMKTTSARRRCAEESPLEQSKSPLVDDDFRFTSSTSNFFDEVITAVREKEREVNRSEGSDGSETVYTNVQEWSTALKQANHSNSKPSTCKLGSTKQRPLQRHVSLQENCCRQDRQPGSDKLVRRHSDVPPNLRQDSKRSHDTTRPSCGSETADMNNVDLLNGVARNLPSFSHASASPVPSSAFYPYQRHHTSPLCSQLHVENEQRRYSITSADLEDIFSEFADRSNSSRKISSELFASSSSEKESCDYNGGGLVVCDGISGEKDELNAETMMVSRSCQTEFSSRGKQAKKPKALSQDQLSPACNPLLPISPPVMNEFLQRTGNWNGVLHQPQSSKAEVPCSNAASETKPPVKMKSISDEPRRPISTVSSCHSLTSTGDGLAQLADGRTSRKRPIQPASHMTPTETARQLPSSPVASLKPKPSNTSLHRDVASEDSPQTFPLTPSKLSFHNKLCLFECRSMADRGPTSTDKQHFPISLDAEQQTQPIKIGDAVQVRGTAPLKEPSRHPPTVCDGEFQTSTPKVNVGYVVQRSSSQNPIRCKSSLHHEEPQHPVSYPVHRSLSNITVRRDRSAQKTRSMANMRCNDAIFVSLQSPTMNEESSSSSMLDESLGYLAREVVDNLLEQVVATTRVSTLPGQETAPSPPQSAGASIDTRASPDHNEATFSDTSVWSESNVLQCDTDRSDSEESS